MSKYIVIIEGDMNDGDNKSVVHEVKKDEIEIVKRVAKAIKKRDKANPYSGNNWPSYDMRHSDDLELSEMYPELTEDDIQYFDGLVPSGGDYPVHSVDSIAIYEYVKKEEIL